jgi:hypothetical protein
MVIAMRQEILSENTITIYQDFQRVTINMKDPFLSCSAILNCCRIYELQEDDKNDNI